MYKTCCYTTENNVGINIVSMVLQKELTQKYFRSLTDKIILHVL